MVNLKVISGSLSLSNSIDTLLWTKIQKVCIDFKETWGTWDNLPWRLLDLLQNCCSISEGTMGTKEVRYKETCFHLNTSIGNAICTLDTCTGFRINLSSLPPARK